MYASGAEMQRFDLLLGGPANTTYWFSATEHFISLRLMTFHPCTHNAKLGIEVVLRVLFQRVERCVVVNGRLEGRVVIVTQDVHEVQVPRIITNRGGFCVISPKH
jgi:hypothetical protein